MALSLLSLMIGCSDNATSGDNAESIADEFGGFEPTDEAAAFGNSEMLSEMSEDDDFNDDILLSPAVDSIINDEEVGAYVIRIAWGSLRYDSTVTEVTDWSGSLTITRGAEVVRKTIKFEPGQDYILPRTERTLIEWVSLTTVHYDGILANIYIPPVDTSDSNYVDEPVTVTFNTEPFSVTFTLDELAALDTVYYLDDGVNAVAFSGHKLLPMGCPVGFLDGRWGVDSTGAKIFYGRWIAANGYLAGHLMGTWGSDEGGTEANVFYGKYIDVFGKFEGLLKGVYIPHPGPGYGVHNARFGGRFVGHIFNADGVVIGDLKGHYALPKADDEEGMGFFRGRWKTYCGNMINYHYYDGFDE